LPDIHRPQLQACDFCDEFAGGSANGYASRYGRFMPERLILASGSFRIVPSLGQIVEGHLLVIPSVHICAVADLAKDQVSLLDGLCSRVRSILRDAYGACVLFEHGIRGAGIGGCGIEHAHLHAVPVRAEGVLDVLTREFGGRPIQALEDIGRELPREQSYLFFEDASAARHVFPVDSLPSQYMRKVVAESIGKSDWDWRSCGREPELATAVERLSPLFSAQARVNEG
jgi:diadenosine tetraphosphate (Ap4A) HIT family hydrolase